MITLLYLLTFSNFRPFRKQKLTNENIQANKWASRKIERFTPIFKDKNCKQKLTERVGFTAYRNIYRLYIPAGL